MTIEEPADASACHDMAALLDRVWGVEDGRQVFEPGLIRALAHEGAYVAGAYADDGLVGAAVGFFAADGHLHSHVLGVIPAGRGRGAAYALKQHQRTWALARGITTVTWTFDPLVGRNAYVNIHKLGASPTEYLTDFYGSMRDGINTVGATDRLYVTWNLNSPRAVGAADGERADVDAAAARGAGAVVLLDRRAGEPVPGGPPGGTGVALVAVPVDIEALRRERPKAAETWRQAVRGALTTALDAGYRIAGMDHDGWYVLERVGLDRRAM